MEQRLLRRHKPKTAPRNDKINPKTTCTILRRLFQRVCLFLYYLCHIELLLEVLHDHRYEEGKYEKRHRKYYIEPKKIHGQAMDFYIRQNKEQGAEPRLGIAVPKRCIKHAVLRNRIKRHLREIFRLNHVPLLGFDLIVMVKSGMTKVSGEDYGKVINEHWNRLIKQCETPH